MAKFMDLTGQKFGKLVVWERGEDYVSPQGRKVVRWRCRCDCGNIKDITASHLRSGDNLSCGCYHHERLIEGGKLYGFKRKHGQAKTRLYHIHQNMRDRCNNQNNACYENYGGRGIKVCKEWDGASGFEAFRKWSVENGYNENDTSISIDRIDVNGDYCPENCRWADSETQGNNTTKTVKLTYNGKTQSAAQWARELGLDRHTIYDRIRRGYPIEYILSPRFGTTRPKIPKNDLTIH